MTTHVLIDAAHAGRGEAKLAIQECNSYDLIAVADRLDLFADEKVRPVRHHDQFTQNGVSIPSTHRVMLCLVDNDGVVALHSYGAEFTEYYARGTAAYLRTQATMPQMQQAAAAALVAMEAAKAQAKAAVEQAKSAAQQIDGNGGFGKMVGGLFIP